MSKLTKFEQRKAEIEAYNGAPPEYSILIDVTIMRYGITKGTNVTTAYMALTDDAFLFYVSEASWSQKSKIVDKLILPFADITEMKHKRFLGDTLKVKYMCNGKKEKRDIMFVRKIRGFPEQAENAERLMQELSARFGI